MFFALPDLRELSSGKPQGLRARDALHLPMEISIQWAKQKEHPKAHVNTDSIDSNTLYCHLQLQNPGLAGTEIIFYSLVWLWKLIPPINVFLTPRDGSNRIKSALFPTSRLPISSSIPTRSAGVSVAMRMAS